MVITTPTPPRRGGQGGRGPTGARPVCRAGAGRNGARHAAASRGRSLSYSALLVARSQPALMAAPALPVLSNGVYSCSILA